MNESKWINMGNELPEFEKNVLVVYVTTDTNVVGIGITTIDKYSPNFKTIEGKTTRITHWQTLPELPIMEG